MQSVLLDPLGTLPHPLPELSLSVVLFGLTRERSASRAQTPQHGRGVSVVAIGKRVTSGVSEGRTWVRSGTVEWGLASSYMRMGMLQREKGPDLMHMDEKWVQKAMAAINGRSSGRKIRCAIASSGSGSRTMDAPFTGLGVGERNILKLPSHADGLVWSLLHINAPSLQFGGSRLC